MYGKKLGYFILMSMMFSQFIQLTKASIKYYKRFKDRKFKMNVKKKEEDSDDDAPNTR